MPPHAKKCGFVWNYVRSEQRSVSILISTGKHHKSYLSKIDIINRNKGEAKALKKSFFNARLFMK